MCDSVEIYISNDTINDITNKPKSFFKQQKLVNFKKKWFFNDHIFTNPEKPNLEYLSKIEKNYGII